MQFDIPVVKAMMETWTYWHQNGRDHRWQITLHSKIQSDGIVNQSYDETNKNYPVTGFWNR